MYLNEQKVVFLAEAAVLADEFSLTHKSVSVRDMRHEKPVLDNKTRSPKASQRYTPVVGEARACFLPSQAQSLNELMSPVY